MMPPGLSGMSYFDVRGLRTGFCFGRNEGWISTGQPSWPWRTRFFWLPVAGRRVKAPDGALQNSSAWASRPAARSKGALMGLVVVFKRVLSG